MIEPAPAWKALTCWMPSTLAQVLLEFPARSQIPSQHFGVRQGPGWIATTRTDQPDVAYGLPRGIVMSKVLQRQRIGSNLSATDCCTAATLSSPFPTWLNKSNLIKTLIGSDAILTCLDAVSMVRAAFEGDGASFPQPQHRFGCPHHGGRHGRRRRWKSRSIVLRRSCAFRKARKSGPTVVRNQGQPQNQD